MKTLLHNFRNYIVPPFCTMDVSPFAQFVSQVSKARAQHLEMMAAAYLKATRIPIKDAVLVEQRRYDGSIVYYFQRKKDT